MILWSTNSHANSPHLHRNPLTPSWLIWCHFALEWTTSNYFDAPIYVSVQIQINLRRRDPRNSKRAPQTKVEGNKGNDWKRTVKYIVFFPGELLRMLEVKQSIWYFDSIHYLCYLLFWAGSFQQKRRNKLYYLASSAPNSRNNGVGRMERDEKRKVKIYLCFVFCIFYKRYHKEMIK